MDRPAKPREVLAGFKPTRALLNQSSRSLILKRPRNTSKKYINAIQLAEESFNNSKARLRSFIQVMLA